ncbi:MAG: ATP-binding protein [Gammaproteobacteria bacterium]|nr:ATP-binding protein [Gammaproteobacteria bacterium]
MLKNLKIELPKASDINNYRSLKPMARWLAKPEIWQFNRRTASGATFIGLFCAFLPIPSQMVIAAPLSIIFRCNLPLAIAWVWISNPITVTPIYYFCYQLGAWLLNRELEVTSIEITWQWFTTTLSDIAYPLLTGSLICGWVAGITGFIVVRMMWRLKTIKRWRQRQSRDSLKN